MGGDRHVATYGKRWTGIGSTKKERKERHREQLRRFRSGAATSEWAPLARAAGAGK
jgi:hypothetical protein